MTVIKNGGFEQGVLEMVKKLQELSDKDEKRLQKLKSLPQDRIEYKRRNK